MSDLQRALNAPAGLEPAKHAIQLAYEDELKNLYYDLLSRMRDDNDGSMDTFVANVAIARLAREKAQKALEEIFSEPTK